MFIYGIKVLNDKIEGIIFFELIYRQTEPKKPTFLIIKSGKTVRSLVPKNICGIKLVHIKSISNKPIALNTIVSIF